MYMRLVHNIDEVHGFLRKGEEIPIREYPSHYPCFMVKKNLAGGMSSVYRYIYCPDGYDFESWSHGMMLGFETKLGSPNNWGY